MDLNFICGECGRKQKLDVGEVHIIVTKENYTDPDTIFYEKEVRCKSCRSTHLELQKLEYPVLIMRKALTHDEEISIGNTFVVEGNPMPFSEVEPYIKRRVNQEPENGELRLRYANLLRKFNEYDNAIAEYTKSLELDSTLLASLVNLTDIFYHRNKQYKEKGAITKAKKYFKRVITLYQSGNANFVTIEDKKVVPFWIEDMRELLHIKKFSP